MKFWTTLDKKYVEKLVINLDFQFPKSNHNIYKYLCELYNRQNNKIVDSLVYGIIEFRDKQIKDYESYVDSIRISKYNVNIEDKYVLEMELNNEIVNQLMIIDSNNYHQLKDNEDIDYIKDQLFKQDKTNTIKLGFIDHISKNMIKGIYPAVRYHDRCIKYSTTDTRHIDILKRYL